MGLHASARLLRLSAVSFLVAVAAGCGGSAGESVALPPADPPAAPAPPPPPLSFGEFPSAAVVLGQSSFESSGFGDTLDTFNFPVDVAVTADDRLIVADGNNDALKVFSQYDSTATGRAADFQIDVAARAVSTTGSKVALVEGNQVKIFNSWPTASGPLPEPAAVAGTVLGGCSAEDMLFPSAAYITPRGRLIVADGPNHRVLIWTSIPEAGSLGPADVVIGQPHMGTCNLNGGEAVATAGGLSDPKSVWSDDTKLVVSDNGNNRVLVWNTFPGTFQPADHVIGQPDFSGSEPNAGAGPTDKTLSAPWVLDVNDRGQLAIADNENSRVLIWNAIPASNGQPADQVIGQPDFVSNSTPAPSATSVRFPRGVRFHNRNLIVASPEGNRVLVWRALD